MHVDFVNPSTFNNVEDFWVAYIAWNRPVIVGKGLMKGWPALENWKKVHLIAPGPRGDVQAYQGKTPYSKKLGHPQNKTTVREYLAEEIGAAESFARPVRDHPLYVFEEMQSKKTDRKEHNLVQNWGSFLSDFTVPPLFALPENDVWETNKQHPPVKQFYVGPRGSGTHPHAHKGAINCMVYGRKRWILIPPEYTDVIPEPLPSQLFMNETVPELAARNVTYFDFVQEAGEVVFVPHMWTHAVYNLEDSVGVAWQLGASSHKVDQALFSGEQPPPTGFEPKMA